MPMPTTLSSEFFALLQEAALFMPGKSKLWDGHRGDRYESTVVEPFLCLRNHLQAHIAKASHMDLVHLTVAPPRRLTERTLGAYHRRQAAPKPTAAILMAMSASYGPSGMAAREHAALSLDVYPDFLHAHFRADGTDAQNALAQRVGRNASEFSETLAKAARAFESRCGLTVLLRAEEDDAGTLWSRVKELPGDPLPGDRLHETSAFDLDVPEELARWARLPNPTVEVLVQQRPDAAALKGLAQCLEEFYLLVLPLAEAVWAPTVPAAAPSAALLNPTNEKERLRLVQSAAYPQEIARNHGDREAFIYHAMKYLMALQFSQYRHQCWKKPSKEIEKGLDEWKSKRELDSQLYQLLFAARNHVSGADIDPWVTTEKVNAPAAARLHTLYPNLHAAAQKHAKEHTLERHIPLAELVMAGAKTADTSCPDDWCNLAHALLWVRNREAHAHSRAVGAKDEKHGPWLKRHSDYERLVGQGIVMPAALELFTCPPIVRTLNTLHVARIKPSAATVGRRRHYSLAVDINGIYDLDVQCEWDTPIDEHDDFDLEAWDAAKNHNNGNEYIVVSGTDPEELHYECPFYNVIEERWPPAPHLPTSEVAGKRGHGKSPSAHGARRLDAPHTPATAQARVSGPARASNGGRERVRPASDVETAVQAVLQQATGPLDAGRLYDAVARALNVTAADRSLRVSAKRSPKWEEEVLQAARALKKRGVVDTPTRGLYALTEAVRASAGGAKPTVVALSHDERLKADPVYRQHYEAAMAKHRENGTHAIRES